MGVSTTEKPVGDDVFPREIVLDGQRLGYVKAFKHTSTTAVGLYEGPGDKVVLKRYYRSKMWGLPAAWAGRLMARHEAAALCAVQDLRGVPRFRGFYDRASIIHDYVPGVALTRKTRVEEEFFRAFSELLEGIHARGMAYVDLEKAANILRGDDGLPHLIDFQVAFYVRNARLRRFWPVRWLAGQLQKSDRYHAGKHFRRLMRESVSPDQLKELYRKPWMIMVGNAVHLPYKKLRRRLLHKD